MSASGGTSPDAGSPDPYSGQPADPYGAGSADPYGAGSADPYGAGSADPFTASGGSAAAMASEPRHIAALVTAGAAGLALLLFIGSLTIWAQTSKSDLCAAYTKASGQVADDSTYYVDLDPLIEAAKHYSGESVRTSAENLDEMSSTFSPREFYTAASAIGVECTGGSY